VDEATAVQRWAKGIVEFYEKKLVEARLNDGAGGY
jgi:hypothetical protein